MPGSGGHLLSPGSDPSLIDLVLAAPGWTCKPGQFVMLRPAHWGAELVWPRPFSVCDVSDKGLRIIFQTVGRGTRKLAELKPGDR
jgi:dihydroorotate dehydrogenase electron transfer subunit